MSRYHTKTSTNQSAPGQPSRNLADLGPDSAHPRRHRTNEEWVAWLTGPLPLADRLAIEIDAARAEEQRAWDAEARFTPDVVAAVHADGRRLLTIPPPITGAPRLGDHPGGPVEWDSTNRQSLGRTA